MTRSPKENKKKDNSSDDKTTNRLEEVLQLMNDENLQELEMCDGSFRVKLVRRPLTPPTLEYNSSHRPKRKSEKKSPSIEETGVSVKSPLAGVFYRASSPQAPSFVKEGDLVTPEKTLCIVEAMKVLNQINAGVTGRIRKVCLENGKPVHVGQTLFIVDPHE